MEKKESAEKAVRDIRRKTRRRFSAEEKIRIVIEGLRGDTKREASTSEVADPSTSKTPRSFSVATGAARAVEASDPSDFLTRSPRTVSEDPHE